MKKYQIAVIGAGSGGLVAATTAKRLGASVVMIEGHKVGGECLHSGCVPSKALIHAAKIYHETRHAGRLGLPVSMGELHFESVMNRVHEVVQDIYSGENPDVFRTMGIDVLEGFAEFISSNILKVGTSEIAFDKAIICTGSSPLILPIKGLSTIDFLTNENIWELRTLPSSMLIIGGGPISVEMAQSFGRFGCRVTVVEMLDRILPREDPSVSAAIKSILEKEGVHCLVLSEVEKLELKSNSIAVSINSNSSVTVQDFESVFVSIGRKPNIEKLNLKKAGVTYSRKGIDINTFLQTSIPHIYACGDVASPYQFTHTAGYQADIAAHNAVHGNNMENDFSVVPWVIFSDPEIARVGMTEEEARNKYGNIQVLQVNADSVDRPKTEGKTTGFVKIILDESDQIVGAHAVGERSGEYIHEIALVMKYKLGIKAVAQLIHAYPTYSEIVRKAAVRYLRTKETV